MEPLRVKTAIILAAGKGRRLDRSDQPKALVQIGYKPLLLWNLEQLEQAGVERCFVVIGEKGEQIRREFTAHPSLKVRPTFVELTDFDGTMLESIQAAMKEATQGGDREAMYLVMSDLVLSQSPYQDLSTLHGDADMTVLVGQDAVHAEASGAQSFVEIQDGRVKAMGREIPTKHGREVGVYLLGSRMVDALIQHPVDRAQRMDDVWSAVLPTVRAQICPLPGVWFDVNTPGTAVRAEIFVRSAQQFLVSPHTQTAFIAPMIDAMFARSRQMETKIVIKRGLIDDLDHLGLIEPSRYRSPHFLLTDAVVDSLYADRVLAKFRSAGFQMMKLVMPAGEHAKNFDTYTMLADQILAHGMDEGSVLVNVGGGVVNNMAGFLAATLYRGVSLIHIPTTTMAQVDAAIDFKQAVNSKKGKNLTGAYHPASYVLIDPDTLATLPERHLRNGLAESLKHALTQDPDFFAWLLSKPWAMDDLVFWDEVIRRSIALKVPLLNGLDQKEMNEMIPQYGHCVGHAVEHVSGYEFLHGEGVTIGMCVSAEIARLIGVCDDATVEAHYQLCKHFSLPTVIPTSMAVEDILNTIRYDKHYLGSIPRMGLVSTIGTMWQERGVVSIPIDDSILERAIALNQARV